MPQRIEHGGSNAGQRWTTGFMANVLSANAPEADMNRIQQWILIVSTIVASWLGMQAVHESGHVVGTWLTGGRVGQVVLYPLTISRTDLAENPHPLAVVWVGQGRSSAPWFRCFCGVQRKRSGWRGRFSCGFFAGFCLIANGLYIGAGSFDRVGDCGQMLRHGSPIWTLWFFGIITTPLGLWLWHGQGRNFWLGSGSDAGVSRDRVGDAWRLASRLLLLGFIISAREIRRVAVSPRRR